MPDRQALTDNEGAILTLVLRKEGITAYQIAKFFEASPVHTLNTSKGTLYPLVHRLKERGLLQGEEVSDDKRGTQRYSCAAAGKRALKRWVLTVRPEHELLFDPLRKKLQGFGLLSEEQQLKWITSTRARLEHKLRAVEHWPVETEPFGDLVQNSAMAALKARLAWLDAVLKRVGRP